MLVLSAAGEADPLVHGLRRGGLPVRAATAPAEAHAYLRDAGTDLIAVRTADAPTFAAVLQPGDAAPDVLYILPPGVATATSAPAVDGFFAPADPALLIQTCALLLDRAHLRREQRRLGEDEQRLQRRLLLGERMAAVGQLAAGLAHEINNPVCFAYSNLQVARDLLRSRDAEALRSGGLDDLPELLDESLLGLSRVRDIVRDLRTFTSTEVRGQADEVRLDDVLDVVLRLTRSEVQERGRLLYDRDLNPMPPVRGDAGKLSHVVMNLVHHALHNLPTGPSAADGCITVRTRADRQRGWVELTVADTGPTLPEELRAHLFEPFARRAHAGLPVKGPGGSAALGLGLAASHEIIRRLGGEIESRAIPGGNELVVRLPASPTSSPISSPISS